MDFKLRVVGEYLAGEGSMNGIAVRHGICYSLLDMWVKKFQRGELVDACVYRPGPRL